MVVCPPPLVMRASLSPASIKNDIAMNMYVGVDGRLVDCSFIVNHLFLCACSITAIDYSGACYAEIIIVCSCEAAER